MKSLFTSNPESAIAILIVGLNQTALPSGVIATLAIQVSSSAPAGVYSLEIDNAVGSDAGGWLYSFR